MSDPQSLPPAPPAVDMDRVMRVATRFLLSKWHDETVPNPWVGEDEPRSVFKFLHKDLMKIYTREGGPNPRHDFHTPYWALVQGLRRMETVLGDGRSSVEAMQGEAKPLPALMRALAANLPDGDSFVIFALDRKDRFRRGYTREVATENFRQALLQTADGLDKALAPRPPVQKPAAPARRAMPRPA